jgi:4a-hydroxytetrahydrobiopterin dehydratase
VTVDLTTPDVKGVTMKDVILAYTADHIANVISSNQKNSIFDSIDIHVENLISSWNNNYS